MSDNEVIMWSILSTLITCFIGAILVNLALISCMGGINKYQPWPAYVVYDDLTDYESSLISDSINEMNFEARRSVVALTPIRGNYKITLRKVTEFSSPIKRLPSVIGMAHRKHSECTIEIKEIMFEEDQRTLPSVVWHEIGHCAGLQHSHNYYDIMYKNVGPFYRYTPDDVYNFIKSMLYSMETINR